MRLLSIVVMSFIAISTFIGMNSFAIGIGEPKSLTERAAKLASDGIKAVPDVSSSDIDKAAQWAQRETPVLMEKTRKIVDEKVVPVINKAMQPKPEEAFPGY